MRRADGAPLPARSRRSSTSCAPDVVVPEVGSETMRTAAHLIGARARHRRCCSSSTRSSRDPLRLYVDTMHAPIVGRGRGARARAPPSAPRSRRSSPRFTARDKPIREYRARDGHAGQAARLRPPRRGHARPRDRDNEYLRPHRFVDATSCASAPRALAARRLLRAAAARAAVRLLPAARRRRLQDQARDPALLRPGVDHRAGRATRCRTATTSCSRSTRCRSGATGSRCCAGCARMPERAPRRPAHVSSHELIRGAGGGRGDLARPSASRRCCTTSRC